MDGYATLSHILDPWIFGDNPATAHYRDFDLARHEYWLAFSPDAVDILYLVATLYTRTHWWTGNGDDDYCVRRDWIGFVGGAEIRGFVSGREFMDSVKCSLIWRPVRRNTW